MRIRPLLAILLAAVASGVAGCGDDRPGSGADAASSTGAAAALPAAGPERGPDLLVGRAKRLDGRTMPLSGLRGRVVLVVNTASHCGYTPQYEGLEALHRRRRADGFAVLGVPSNDFGGQEPGGAGEIARFCRLNYGVSFPMLAKSSVTGPAAVPLMRAIARRPEPAGAPPSWNFTKYLLDREGRLVARFAPSVSPDDPVLVAAVDRLLAERPPA